MDYIFKNVCLQVFKCLISAIFIIYLNIFNYNIGVNFCEKLGIPKDFALTMFNPSMTINVTIILFVIEMIILFCIVKELKRIKIINNFFENFM